ncbi:MAG: Lipoprotein-releasing system ATP-binding protein LolD [Nitrospira sp.]|nr:Lipoprotein-releasing system ATP-binding protein LolD [Nitrospira sp.]
MSPFPPGSRVALVYVAEQGRVGTEKQMTMVTFKQVSKVYKRGGDIITGLDRVTVEVAEGDFCAFIGPSGCGKSTLLNLVAGLDLPTSGELFLEGRSTSRFTSDDWTGIRRDKIGIIFQAFHLIPGLTAAENVAFPLLLRGERGASVQTRVEEVLELVSMTARRHHRPSELSGGEQQRVAMARAIVHRPQIILADEPTGNLDSQHGAEIILLLRSLVQHFCQTVLLVTHSVAAAEAADYVWAMKDGQLVTKTSQQPLTVGG